MDWIFDHFWVVIAIAGVLTKVFQAARNRKSGGETGRTDPEKPKEYEFEDPELAERTRKIREEIQRKIEQRRGQQLQPPAAQEPPPLVQYEPSPEATTRPVSLPEILREAMQPSPPPVTVPNTRTQELFAAEEAERQAALEEQLLEAAQMKAAALRRTAFEAATADGTEAARQGARADVLGDLRDPAALRRAFILREIIGPPVALR